MKRIVYLVAFSVFIAGCGAKREGGKEGQVATLVAGTMAAVPTQTSVPSPSPVPPIRTPVPTGEPEPTAARSNTYWDEDLGFAFDYPGDWAVAYQEGQSRGRFFQFAREDFQPDPDAGGLPVEEILLQVTILNWDPKWELEVFLEVRRQAWDSSGIEVLSEKRWSWDGEIPAATFILKGVDGQQSLIIFTYAGDRYLTFSTTDDFQVVEDAARTLRIP